MTPQIEIRATFAEASAAEAAAAVLAESGRSRTAIELQHCVLPEARRREARFLWRVLVTIVLWSIAGAVPGAVFGWLLAKTIGPEGTAGLIVQVVCWTIVGHLVAGMLAGYALLADRSAEEMRPDRPVSLLTVCVPEVDLARVRGLVRATDPLELQIAEA
jgi:cation transporter-like permease